MSPDERSEQRQRAGGGGTVRFLHRRWQALVFALLASALSLAAYWFHPELLENLDQRSRDVAFRWREPLPPPADVAIIAIDEASLHAHGRWPWPRSVQAQLIGRLMEHGPAVIALDIVYAQPSNEACNCADQDEMLRAALAMTGAKVIGGYFFRPESSGETGDEVRALLAANRIKQKLVRAGGRLDTVPEWPHVQASQAEFAREMDGLGFFNRHTDIDGLVRTVPLVMRFDGELYPSLALRALAAYRDEEPGIVADSTGIAEIRLGETPIPVDEQGRMTANFYDLGAGIPVISAADVMAGNLQAGQLQGKLLLVGVTETGVGDLVPTPVAGQFPGVAVHATAAGNIIQQNYLYKDLGTVLYDVALIAVIPLVSIMLMAFMVRMLHMAMAMLFFSALLGAVFYYLVAHQAQLVSLIYPAAALITAFTAYQVYFMLTSQRTTRFLTNAFGSYVSPEVVDRLLLTPESLGLSGEERDVTVLFSDIRGFTTVSETLEPRRLVDLLNEFFD
ncbi:MAG: CHASE2 domain-containing protein, partial [Xanthomonadales bacterium]|nr:CHASE2 domain-containing protein [Xanthomonadales bacterium]